MSGSPEFYGLELPIHPEGTPVLHFSNYATAVQQDQSWFIRQAYIEAPSDFTLRQIIDTTESGLERIEAFTAARPVSHQWCLVKDPSKKSSIPGHPDGFTFAVEVAAIEDISEPFGPDSTDYYIPPLFLRERSKALLKHPRATLGVVGLLLSPQFRPHMRDIALRQIVSGRERPCHLNDNQSYEGAIFTDIEPRLQSWFRQSDQDYII